MRRSGWQTICKWEGDEESPELCAPCSRATSRSSRRIVGSSRRAPDPCTRHRAAGMMAQGLVAALMVVLGAGAVRGV